MSELKGKKAWGEKLILIDYHLPKERLSGMVAHLNEGSDKGIPWAFIGMSKPQNLKVGQLESFEGMWLGNWH